MGYFDDAKKRQEWAKELDDLTQQREAKLSGKADNPLPQPEAVPPGTEEKAAKSVGALREEITLEQLMREADVNRSGRTAKTPDEQSARLDRTLGAR